jgi:hypothetical protein
MPVLPCNDCKRPFFAPAVPRVYFCADCRDRRAEAAAAADPEAVTLDELAPPRFGSREPATPSWHPSAGLGHRLPT